MPLLAVPWLLWGLPLALAPIVWHLFLRPRRQTVAFPSLMFFLKVEPRLEGRRKLREYLILALRCLLLAALVLALARPYLPAIGGGGATAVAVVLDTSASMAAPGADGRPLGRTANEAAVALLHHLGQAGPGNRAVLIPTAPDPAVVLPQRPVGDLKSLTTALDRLGPTEAMGDAAGALVRGAAALADDHAGNRELIVVTDLQSGEWDVPAKLPPLPPGVRVTVYALAPRAGSGGVDVTQVVPPAGRPVAGRPARCLVGLANRSRAEATVAARITRPDGTEDVRDVTIPAGGETTLPVLLTAPAAGPTWGLVRLEGTAAGTAQRAGLAVWAQERIAAVLLGNPKDFGPLSLALAPDGNGAISGIVPQVVPMAGLVTALQKRPSLVVVSWHEVSALPGEPLQAWIAAGGTLLVLPAGEAGLPPTGVPAWVGCAPVSEARLSPPATPVLPDPGAACWEQVRDLAGVVGVKLRIQRAWPLEGPPGQRIVLALPDGRPVLSERPLGRGLIVTSGLAFHPGWSDLPLKGWSLALVQGLALRGAATSRIFDLVAGQGLPPAPGDRSPSRLRSLAGGSLDWQGPRAEVPVLVQAGIYQWETIGSPATLVAVRAAPEEGRQRYADPTGSAQAALLAGLDARSVAIKDAAELTADWQRQRRGFDLLPWLLGLALVCWLAEGWLAAGDGWWPWTKAKEVRP